MTSDEQFARRVLAAFERAGHFTDDRVRAAGGPSSTSMTAFRKAARGEAPLRPARGDLLDRIDRAAGWRPGSARALLVDGEEPVLDDSGSRPPIDLSSLPYEDLLAELQRRGRSEGRDARRRQDEAGEAPDADGPEGGA